MIFQHYFLPFYFLVFLVATSRAEDEERPCTTHHNGKLYDLTPLKSRVDYHVKGTDDKVFAINVCQPAKTETYGVKDSAIPEDEIVSFIRRDKGDFVIGKVNKTMSVIDKKVRMTLSQGSKCIAANGDRLAIRASTVIDFICDSGVLGPGQPQLVAQLPPGHPESSCAFFIEWRTHYACPIAEGGFMWGLFVFLSVTFLSILMAYTVLGTLYNRYVLQLRGFDQIPQFSFESMKYHSREAIDWLKDIAAGLDIPGSNNGGLGGGGYGRVPSHTRGGSGGGLNSFSHQAQAGGFSIDEEAGTGFARPGRKQTDINPVSHQSQVIAETQALAAGSQSQPQSLSFNTPPTQARSPPTGLLARPAPTKLEVREATPEERELIFGDEDSDEDDEDDDEEEEEDKTPKDGKYPQVSGGRPNPAP